MCYARPTMSSPSRRTVKIIDGRTDDRPTTLAELVRDLPAADLERVEAVWREARERLVSLTPVDHAHWDWRNKADSVEAGLHRLVAVESEGEPQGMMAVQRAPRAALLGGGQAVYVDYLEVAPWNLRTPATSPRFLGVGTVLLADAVRLGVESGFGGRVGLHSLPQAEPFYARCRMTCLGTDPGYYDLTYFEYTEHQATDWLAAIGEAP